MRRAILNETVAGVTDILGLELDEIAIDRVAIGRFFIGVKLSTGQAGACATPIKTIPEAACRASSAKKVVLVRRAADARADAA